MATQTYRVTASNTRLTKTLREGLTLAEAEALKVRLGWDTRTCFLIVKIEAE